MTDELAEARAQIAVLREALEAFRKVKAQLGADSYDGIEPLYRTVLEEADARAAQILAATPADCYAQIRAEVLGDVAEQLRKAERGDALQVLANYRAVRSRVLKDKP